MNHAVERPEKPSWTPRRVATGSLVVLVALALVVFVPGWGFTVYHKRRAHDLINQVEKGRPAVLQSVAEEHLKLRSLGEPVRAWSAVSCSLRPRQSDGDGERDVVVFYYQHCSPVAYEIYELPPSHRTLEQAAALVHGRVGTWDHYCTEPIMDVTRLGLGQLDPTGQSMDLWWIDPAGQRARGAGECTLPTPDADGVVRVERTKDKPLNHSTYVVLTVFGHAGQVDVGCRRNIGWIGVCTAPPKGAPYL